MIPADTPTGDRSDPGVRAATRFATARRRDQTWRAGGATTLVAGGVAGVVTAAATIGTTGAIVGTVTAALVLAAVAAVVWPHEWTPEEHTHRELESIWRELRSDGDREVPWPRFAAWASPTPRHVELGLIEHAPAAPRCAGAPSPLRWQPASRVDPDEIAAAAEAMDALREQAERRELDARQRHERSAIDHELRRHDSQLRELEAGTDRYEQERERAMREEIAEQDALDRAAQAEAVAAALRRS